MLYVRYIDLENASVQTKSLGVLPYSGHPNADTIFHVLDCAFMQYELPMDFLVAHTSDGASVMLSTQRGVVAKVKALYNSKLFMQHCLNHRIVLACKAGQHHIPKDVEDTICDVLNINFLSIVLSIHLDWKGA